MVDLMSSGFSRALLAANSSAKAAAHPMNIVSREMQKSNPDMQVIQRAGKYGNAELNKAGKSLNDAQEELKKAQKIAKEEQKAEEKARLEEKKAEAATEKTEAQSQVNSTGAVTSPTPTQNADGKVSIETPQADRIELSPEALSKIQQQNTVVIDAPKIYSPAAVAVAAAPAPQPTINILI